MKSIVGDFVLFRFDVVLFVDVVDYVDLMLEDLFFKIKKKKMLLSAMLADRHFVAENERLVVLEKDSFYKERELTVSGVRQWADVCVVCCFCV